MEWQPGFKKGKSPGSEKPPASSTNFNKLSKVDFNLLVALDALLKYRNVTHAARRLGQTQPAVSRALARLRDLLGDDLLVRSSSGLTLTAHGKYLSGLVPATMMYLRDLMSSRLSDRQTRISISSLIAPIVLPSFLASGSRENETLKFAVHKSVEEGVSQLRLGMVDCLLDTMGETYDDIESELVMEEEFITLVSTEHINAEAISNDGNAFIQLRHINLVEEGSEVFPQFSEAFVQNGGRRNRMVEVPDAATAALMINGSDLALTLPRSIAGWVGRGMDLKAVSPAIEILPHQFHICQIAESLDQQGRRRHDEIRDKFMNAIVGEYGSASVNQLS